MNYEMNPVIVKEAAAKYELWSEKYPARIEYTAKKYLRAEGINYNGSEKHQKYGMILYALHEWDHGKGGTVETKIAVLMKLVA